MSLKWHEKSTEEGIDEVSGVADALEPVDTMLDSETVTFTVAEIRAHVKTLRAAFAEEGDDE